MLNADAIDEATLENTLTVLLKHEGDVQKARRAMLRGSGGHPLDSSNRPNRGSYGKRPWN